ncbi:MAG: hypothetical protein AAF141_14365, partial [Pseudomonadota bacterium]
YWQTIGAAILSGWPQNGSTEPTRLLPVASRRARAKRSGRLPNEPPVDAADPEDRIEGKTI